MDQLELGQVQRARSRGINIWIILGLLLITAALCFAAFNLCESCKAGERSVAALAQIEGRDAGPFAKNPLFSPDTPMPTQAIGGNLYIGTLQIPSIGLELPVMNEWSYENLEIAPCRYSGSVYAGNMVIAGHNYAAHFANLTSLSYGDEVAFTDIRGNVFTYEVRSIETIAPEAVEEMASSNWNLTLFTCNFSGTERVAVRCVLGER